MSSRLLEYGSIAAQEHKLSGKDNSKSHGQSRHDCGVFDVEFDESDAAGLVEAAPCCIVESTEVDLAKPNEVGRGATKSAVKVDDSLNIVWEQRSLNTGESDTRREEKSNANECQGGERSNNTTELMRGIESLRTSERNESFGGVYTADPEVYHHGKDDGQVLRNGEDESRSDKGLEVESAGRNAAIPRER